VRSSALGAAHLPLSSAECPPAIAAHAFDSFPSSSPKQDPARKRVPHPSSAWVGKHNFQQARPSTKTGAPSKLRLGGVAQLPTSKTRHEKGCPIQAPLGWGSRKGPLPDRLRKIASTSATIEIGLGTSPAQTASDVDAPHHKGPPPPSPGELHHSQCQSSRKLHQTSGLHRRAGSSPPCKPRSISAPTGKSRSTWPRNHP
jgi:hypothetical protein